MYKFRTAASGVLNSERTGGMLMKEFIIEGQKGLKVYYDTSNLRLKVDNCGKIWCQSIKYKPYVEINIKGEEIRMYFEDAEIKKHELWQTGVGKGIKSVFSDFSTGGAEKLLSFQTIIWIDNIYNDLHFEILPITESCGCIKKILWPGSFESIRWDNTGYTVLPMMQGIIIPNSWNERIEVFNNGWYCTRGFYMPWWGQIERDNGYIAITETPWDGGCDINHETGEPTIINSVWYPSLGILGYKRKIRYSFLDNCDYNDLCKSYRRYIEQKGELVSLKEKAVRNSRVNKLIGSPIIHSSVYCYINPGSKYYDKENPEKNDNLISTFEKKIEQLTKLKEYGVQKALLHLDGWGKRGYDNLHPDVIPPCEKAGGWDGMKKLSDACKEMGYIFAIHDQYRDYYSDAETFSVEETIHNVKGEIPRECIWYGGEQSVLCAERALYYLKRNFEMLKKHEIELRGAYLDVFSVQELDECFYDEHKMTRKECMEKRRECFEFVRFDKILVSSEEPVDWAIPSMEFVHYAPYPLLGNGSPGGILVPLMNLVYHDCIIIPWILTRGVLVEGVVGEKWGIPNSESGFLHALLNGGTGYLSIEASKDEISQAKILCELHEEVAKHEMVKHEFVNSNFRRQRTTFANGTVVEVDFETDEYIITKNKENTQLSL